MKKILFLLISVISIISCSSDDSTTWVGNWVYSYESGASSRGFASTFVIKDTAYLVGGYSYKNNKKVYHRDIFAFTPGKYSWVRKDSFPGEGRKFAIAFAIGNKGYYGTGVNDNGDLLKDLWEFDASAPKGQQWSKAPVAYFTYGISQAVAFAINGKGYIVTGQSDENGSEDATKDTWRFDPSNNSCTNLTGTDDGAAFTGAKRYGAISFVIGDKAYICSGYNNAYIKDMWEFDATNNIWNHKRDIYNSNENESYDDSYAIIRTNAVAFTIGSKGYVTSGSSGSILNDTWEYDPATDLWERKSAFEGTSRIYASAFTVKDRGFILMGAASSSTTFFDDVWEFKPNEELNEYDNK
jgi:N-acetylneuraminic acid mutarotase